MGQINATQITKLCDSWCDASSIPGGGVRLGQDTGQYRLLRNGIVFHELDYEAICSAILGLTKVLLRPGLNTIIDLDHTTLWSWCGELLLSPATIRLKSKIFPPSLEQLLFEDLFATTIYSALALCHKPVTSKEERKEQQIQYELQPYHAKQLLQKSHLVLAHMAFPLLEAVLKRSCSSHVSMDGVILSNFTVTPKQGQPRIYCQRQRCSSLRDLLLLHHTTIAAPKLKLLLDYFRNHLSTLDNNRDPFDLIYTWRNQSLHGSTSFATIGGTILSLVFLIALFDIEPNFEERRELVLNYHNQMKNCSYRGPMSFYPPY